MKDLQDHEKAVCYTNIWYNVRFLGNRYNKELEAKVAKYAPLGIE